MKLIIVLSLLLATASYAYANCRGCVSLDDYNFDKIVKRFKIVLVKFDVAYPYGDKHEAYTKLAEELASHKDILIAEVGIKDYGEKENENLAIKYGIKTKDDYPQVQLFIEGKSIFVFPKTSQWTVDNLRNLIRDNINIYIGLPGCIETFDKLASDFVNGDHKETKVKAAQELVETIPDDEKSTAKIYLLYMQRIIDNGLKFVEQEVSRLGKILKDAKINKKKQDEMSLRLNVLHSFKTELTVQTKEELNLGDYTD